MATKPDPELARQFQQTAALAKKLAKPITVTLHLPGWSRESMKDQAREVGITLSMLISLILSGGMNADEQTLEWALEDIRDDTEAEEEAPR